MPPAVGLATAPAASLICLQCHQPVLPTYYFCPNCGKKLTEAPLSTSDLAQAGLYAFSIILPFLGYLVIGYWQGIRYLRSADPKAKQIGIIALALLLASSAVMLWYSYYLFELFMKNIVGIGAGCPDGLC